jgi:NAD-dependent DNA ligase
MEEVAKTLLSSSRIQELFILSRAMYRLGSPIISDQMYDKIFNSFETSGVLPEFVGRTYDDDPIPHELMKEFGLEWQIPINPEHRAKLHSLLETEKTTSIRPITEYSHAWGFIQSTFGKDLVFSLKADGIFTQKAYKEYDFSIGLSRGRTGECLDLTDGLSYLVPRMVDPEKAPPLFRVYSECQAKSKSLDYLRAKYAIDKYKQEKTAARSMLASVRDADDYKNHLNLLTFRVEGVGTTISESLKFAEDLGFTTIPYLKVNADDVPKTYEEFIEWIRNILDYLHDKQIELDIAADGVVVEVDDKSFIPDQVGQYTARNAALKLEHWSYVVYPAIVEGIITEQGAMFGSCKIAIKPMTTVDRTTAKLVNGFNLSVIEANGIFPGKRIYFERNSGAINTLLYGGRLQEVYVEKSGGD